MRERALGFPTLLAARFTLGFAALASALANGCPCEGIEDLLFRGFIGFGFGFGCGIGGSFGRGRGLSLGLIRKFEGHLFGLNFGDRCGFHLNTFTFFRFISKALHQICKLFQRHTGD